MDAARRNRSLRGGGVIWSASHEYGSPVRMCVARDSRDLQPEVEEPMEGQPAGQDGTKAHVPAIFPPTMRIRGGQP
jgi:hypothetical protein